MWQHAVAPWLLSFAGSCSQHAQHLLLLPCRARRSNLHVRQLHACAPAATTPPPVQSMTHMHGYTTHIRGTCRL